MTPRPMKPSEEAGVRDLFAKSHPAWAPRPVGYFTAFPTLVALDGSRVVGSTSFFVSYPPPSLLPAPDDGFVMWGHGVYVDEATRGHGLGTRLAEARLALARRLGLSFFIGMTWASNKPMIRIFEAHGYTLNPQRVQHAYPENFAEDQTGLMYTKGL